MAARSTRAGWVGLALVAAAGAGATEPAELRWRAWAREVLLGREAGAVRDRVVRWRAPTRYLVVGADRRGRRAVERAFAQLRDAVRGLHELQLSFVDEGDDRVGARGFATLWFVAPRDAAQLLRLQLARPAPADADGWFTVFWDPDFALARAVMFVDPSLRSDWLRHTVLEEMLQVLGVCNDSALQPSSVVYEGTAGAGSAERLAPCDEQLLRLLYGALQPGDDAAAIDAAVRSR